MVYRVNENGERIKLNKEEKQPEPAPQENFEQAPAIVENYDEDSNAKSWGYWASIAIMLLVVLVASFLFYKHYRKTRVSLPTSMRHSPSSMNFGMRHGMGSNPTKFGFRFY